MGSLTEDLPKPMLPLQGKPILEHQIKRLEMVGIEDILLVTGYKANLIEKHFQQYPPLKARLSYQLQKDPNGTGSAAQLARSFINRDAFILTFGDIVASRTVYKTLIEKMECFDAVLTVKQVDDPYLGAAVYTDGIQVTRIIEKPPPGKSRTKWINAGIYGFRPDVFKNLDRIPLSPRGEYELTDAVSMMLNGNTKFGYATIEGFWKDVGRPEDLPIANRLIEDDLDPQ